MGDERGRGLMDAAVRHWSERFAAEAPARAGEPAWLEATRKAALARFVELGVPDRRHEEWRYTNAARIAKVPWRRAEQPRVEPAALAALDLPLGDGPRLVFVNGRFAPALSRAAALPAGVEAASLAELWANAPERLEPLLAQPDPLEDRAFAALARAFAADGAFVRVGRGAATGSPIAIVFLSVPEAEPAAAHPFLVAVAEPGSRAELVEVHASLGEGAHLSNARAELHVGEDARLDHLRLQWEGAGATHLAHVAARIDRAGRLASRTVSVGARVARLDLVATLEGEGAECALDGLYVASDGQHVATHTLVDHRKPHGTSREHYKGVLAGRARGVFSGKVLVRPDARRSDAQQKNDNLLLSTEAEVDSKPQLEIENDDVRCSHGSAIGQLEEDALFYLRARGLGEAPARALLVRAFTGQITGGIAPDDLRAAVDRALVVRLFGGGAAAEAAP